MSESEEDVDLPRFFKAFVSVTDSESMAIPMSFSEHLEDPLPQTAKLQGTGGGVWTVNFKKIRDREYFTSGWPKFAEDNELKDGEYLTFVYDGSHTFEVSVFGRSVCKEIRAVVETVNLSDAANSDEEEDSSVVAADSNEDDDPSFHAGEDDVVSQSINPVDSDDTVSVAEVAAGFSDLEVESNPCFTTTLKHRRNLLIPKDVVNDRELTFCDRIKYIIDGEGIFNGVRAKQSKYSIHFTGWSRICRRNRVKDNDTAHCEMLHIRNKVHSIKITITRG